MSKYLEDLLGPAREFIVLLADDARVEHARRRVEGVDSLVVRGWGLRVMGPRFGVEG